MRRPLLLSCLMLLIFPLASATAATPEVVATGLDNPRGLDIDRLGFIYVSEAGRGGTGPCITGGEGTHQCVGRSGAITRIAFGWQQRIVTRLPSLADEGTGAGAAGPQDVETGLLGPDSFVTGLGANPARRADLGADGAGLGKLYDVSLLGRVSESADLAAYEAANDPDQGQLGALGADSNPSSVLTDGRDHIAVDAGGNDLLRIRSNGQISTLAVFPAQLVDAPPFLPLPPGTKIPAQSVPTAVAKGPDGAYYVSELTGFPFPVAGASIYRVVPGSAPTVYAAGLTNVTDLAFGRDGSLYVVQIAKNGLLSGDPAGEVIKIARNGTRTSIASDGLVEPYGIAIGSRDEIYVSTKSRRAGTGEVVRLR